MGKKVKGDAIYYSSSPTTLLALLFAPTSYSFSRENEKCFLDNTNHK